MPPPRGMTWTEYVDELRDHNADALDAIRDRMKEARQLSAERDRLRGLALTAARMLETMLRDCVEERDVMELVNRIRGGK